MILSAYNDHDIDENQRRISHEIISSTHFFSTLANCNIKIIENDIFKKVKLLFVIFKRWLINTGLDISLLNAKLGGTRIFFILAVQLHMKKSIIFQSR